VTGETKARIAPLAASEWDDDARAAMRDAYSEAGLARFTGPDAPPVPNVLGALLHHPALAGPFLTYNNVLLQKPTLEPRLRELMILRVAARAGCEYEWAQHVRMAARVGITPEEVEAVRSPKHDAWTGIEADALAATDQCIDGYCIDDETWARLARVLDERQLIELCFVVGTYAALAMIFNSLGIELDADLKPVASPSHPNPEE